MSCPWRACRHSIRGLRAILVASRNDDPALLSCCSSWKRRCRGRWDWGGGLKRRRWGCGLPGCRLSGGGGSGDRRLTQPRGGGSEKSRRRRGGEAPRPRCPPVLGEGERAEDEGGEDPPPFSCCCGGGLTTRLLRGARAGCGGAGAGAGEGEGDRTGSVSGSGVLRGGVMSSYSSSSSSMSSPLPRGLILLRVGVQGANGRALRRKQG